MVHYNNLTTIQHQSNTNGDVTTRNPSTRKDSFLPSNPSPRTSGEMDLALYLISFYEITT
jgi:hypothetical protein